MTADERAFEQSQAAAQNQPPTEPQTADEREFAEEGPQVSTDPNPPSKDEREYDQDAP
jgi:hypothetical protein